MSADILDRLNEEAGYHYPGARSQLVVLEAAAEIVRLRGEVESLTYRLDTANAYGEQCDADAVNFLRKHGPALLSRADGGEAPRAVRGMPPFGQMGVPEQ